MICQPCARCGAIIETNTGHYCKPCYAANQRESMRRKRSTPPERQRRTKAERPHPEGTCIDCGATPIYSNARCKEDYLRYQREWHATRRKRSQANRDKAKAAKPKPPAKREPPYVPRPARPVQPDILIGPQAFTKPEPVSVAGGVPRYRSPGLVAEEQQREREWAEWFAARGL